MCGRNDHPPYDEPELVHGHDPDDQPFDCSDCAEAHEQRHLADRA